MYTPTEAAKLLREEYGLLPGKQLYTVLRHVSKSGLTHWIAVLVIDDGHVWDITWHTGLVLGRRVDDKTGGRGVKVKGAGMDMGFELVYNLGRALYPYTGPNGDTDRPRDPGYSFRHRWL